MKILLSPNDATATLAEQTAVKGLYQPSEELLSTIDSLPGHETNNPDAEQPQQPPAKAPEAVKEPDPEPDPEPPKETAKAPEPPKEEPTEDPLGLRKVAKPAPKKEEPKKEPEFKGAPKELRTAYERTKGELEAERKAKAELQAKLDEALKRPVPEDIEKKWKTDIETTGKRAAELEERIRLLDYSQSQEFQDGHIKPLTAAFENAFETLVGKKVRIDGEEKTITQEDVQAVLEAGDDFTASDIAEQRFGNRAGLVMPHRNRIAEMTAKRDEALSTWRQKGTEFQRQQQEQNQALRQTAVATFTGRVDGFKKLYPDLLPKAEDADEVSALAHGEKMNQMAFLEQGLPQFSSPKEAIEFGAKLKGDIAARSALLGIVALRLKRSEATIAELQAKLKEKDASDPEVGGGTRSGGESKGRAPADPYAAFDALQTTDGRE